MEAILRIALSNTLLAAMLALLALAVSRTFRRPALSHALWLIVLLKLITPPLWNIALPLIPAQKTQKPPLPPTELSMPPAEIVEPVRVAVAEPMASAQAEAAGDWMIEKAVNPAAPAAVMSPLRGRLNAADWLMISWGGGSALCVAIIVLRVRRFTRLLRFAGGADAHVQMLARALCMRLGMKKFPRVWFVPGPLCPMLWAFGGDARLLIPTGLWERLDEQGRSTLLLHELAHYRRGDHWIRGLELLITILFWWNPIAWWARHELREAEEQCCDAWVIWTLPRAARDYAIALMEAIDFVSSARLAVPVLASPMGEFHDLKRRLLMIKQNAAPRALGWTGFSMMCALSLLLLPLSATLAQQTERPQPAGLPPVGPATELPVQTTTAPPAPVAVDVATGLVAVTGEAAAEIEPNAAAQAQALEAELQKTSAEITQLTAHLKALQARLTELQRNRLRALGQPDIAPGGFPNTFTRNRGRTATAAAPMAGNMPGMPALNPATNNDQEQRLRTVEKKLDMLIEELRAMRPDRPADQPDRGQPGLQRR